MIYVMTAVMLIVEIKAISLIAEGKVGLGIAIVLFAAVMVLAGMVHSETKEENNV